MSPGEEKNSFMMNLVPATWWTDDSMGLPDDRVDHDGGPGVLLTGRGYISVQLDPKAQRENTSSINVFGRIGTVLMVSCALGEVLPASSFEGNYPKNGTHKLEFTSAIAKRISSVCNNDVEAGEELTLTVSDVTSTNYDKKLNICFGAVEECTNEIAEEAFFYKNTASVLNIVASEDSGQDEENPTHVARTTLSLDRVNDVLKAEYFSGAKALSGSDGNITIHRLYKEGNVGMVVTSLYSKNGGTPFTTAYVLKGNLASQTSAVSLNIRSGDEVGSGCFNRSTGGIDYECELDSVVKVSDVITMTNNLLTNGYNAEDYRASKDSAFVFTGFSDAASVAMSKK